MPHAIIGHLGFLAGSAPGPAKREIEARAPCDLAAGDLYTFPLSTTSVDAAQPLTFKWNTDCQVDPLIDLYLYEPSSSTGRIKGWTGIDFTQGELQVNLNPVWWNNTATAQLQLQILANGAQPWDTTGPSGPVFRVEYDASVTTTVNGQVRTSARVPTVTNGGDAVIETVATANGHKGLAKGAIAAAVVVPIVVLAIIAGVAIRFWRAREAEKRRRWSAAVSTHSGLEWEKGARPGDKPSSILDRPATQYSFRPGSMATSSIYAVENNMAGAGAGGNFPRPSFQLRSQSSESLASGNPRQSRISFAESTRPDRRSRLSLGDNLRPKIGSLPAGSRSASDLVAPNRPSVYASGSAIADDEEEIINMSPSQVQGPASFADADMRRAQGNKTGRRSFMSLGGDKRRVSTASNVSADDFKSAASARGSVDELRDMEAVMLMRRSMISQHSKGSSPAPEAQQEHMETLDNDEPTMPQQPMPAAVGSTTVAYGPDQMLAVYAARGKVSASPMPALPAPGDMRSLVHLNTGTMSSAAVGALPAPGPRSGSSLAVPTLGSTGRANARQSESSEISTYSEDADVGEAK